MFQLSEFTVGFREENDPNAFRLPYKICGSVTKQFFLNKYMNISETERSTLVYPAITRYLS